MGNGILDDVETLMGLTDDELTEALLDSKYNKSNLRELVRRSLAKTQEYKTAFEYQLSQRERMEEQLDSFKRETRGIFDDL